MIAKLGMRVCSEHGEGRIVALSAEWCIHLDEGDEHHRPREHAVRWGEVWLPAPRPELPSAPASLVEELNVRLAS